MSKFTTGAIYIIVPDADITENMINHTKHSFFVTGNKTTNSLRKSTGGVARTLFKIANHSTNTADFEGYQWYNHTEIIAEMTDSGEWD